MTNYSRYICSDINICHGQPCFRGTRIMVYLVLELLEAEETPEEILKSYPQLSKKHIESALHFAAELIKNQEFIPFAQPA